MKNKTAFNDDNPKKKHPFKIEKNLNEINQIRKNKTLINNTYENQFKKQLKNMPIMGDYHTKYEIAQNNKILHDKINEINKYGDKKLSQFMKPSLIINHRNDGYIKLGIMDLAQQNLYMLKRLTEKKSEYSVNKMEEDYKRYQKYKKIKCNFPSINFNHQKRGYSSDNKSERIIKKIFFPTVNYINDGYLEKTGRKIMEKKKKEENNTALKKNLFNEKKNNKNKTNGKKDIIDKIEEEKSEEYQKVEENKKDENKKDEKEKDNNMNNNNNGKEEEKKVFKENNETEEYEYEFDKDEIINISRNEDDNNNNNNNNKN